MIQTTDKLENEEITGSTETVEKTVASHPNKKAEENITVEATFKTLIEEDELNTIRVRRYRLKK